MIVTVLNSRPARLRLQQSNSCCSQSKRARQASAKRSVAPLFEPFAGASSSMPSMRFYGRCAAIPGFCVQQHAVLGKDSVAQNAAHSGRKGNCCEDRLQAAGHETLDPVLFCWGGGGRLTTEPAYLHLHDRFCIYRVSPSRFPDTSSASC